MKKAGKKKDIVAIHEPAVAYARTTTLPTFFGQPMLKGTYAVIDHSDSLSPRKYYTHPNGEIWIGDAIAWLRSLASESVDLIFADPPYNIKKAEWDTFESQQAYVDWSVEWIEQAARVLKPMGTLYVCGYSEILADLQIARCPLFQGLSLADMALQKQS